MIERNGRGVRLTGAAEVLVGHANLGSRSSRRRRPTSPRYSEGAVGTVRLAGFATALGELVAPAVVALRAAHPRLDARRRRAGGA